MFSEENHWVEGCKAFILAILLAVIIKTFLFASYEVRGESMLPTAQNGERFIVNKIGYEFLTPQRFDMIVFHANEEEDYIKRVIALPGESLMYIDDVLFINGESVEEPFLDDRKED